MELDLIKEKLKYWKDPKFSFDEAAHKYTYGTNALDSIEFISVTTFVHDFVPAFDANYHASRIAEKEGVTTEEIQQRWADIAKTACDLGTATHLWIENFYNKKEQPLPENPLVKERVEKFNKIHHEWLKKFEPIAQELRLFSTEWKIAGTMDALFYYPPKKTIYVGDWKTNKVYKHDKHEKGTFNKMLPPFENMWVNEHNSYSVQVSLYRLLLAEQGIPTEGAFLCHIGPDDQPAKIWPAKDLRKPLKEYLDNIWVKKINQPNFSFKH